MPHCECARTNLSLWRKTGDLYHGFPVYFCSGCSELFTLAHRGPVNPFQE